MNRTTASMLVLAASGFGQILNDPPLRLPSATKGDFEALAPLDDRERFVAVGLGIENYEGWRRDAQSGVWSRRLDPPTGAPDARVGWMGVDRSPGQWMAARRAGLKDGMEVGVSKDGVGWVVHQVAGRMWASNLAYGNGAWVAVGEAFYDSAETPSHDRQKGVIQVSSDDGATWSHIETGGGENLFHAHQADGLWVVVGEKNNGANGRTDISPRIYSSTDGNSWSAATVPGKDPLRSVTWGDGRWVAIGNGVEYTSGVGKYFPYVLASDDAQTWSRIDLPFRNVRFQDVAWTENGYIAVGCDEQGVQAWVSPDARAWQAVYKPSVGRRFGGCLNALTTRDTKGSPNRTFIAMAGDSGTTWIDSLVGLKELASLRSDRHGSGWVLERGVLRAGADAQGEYAVEICRVDGSAIEVVAMDVSRTPNLRVHRETGIRVVRVLKGDRVVYRGTILGM